MKPALVVAALLGFLWPLVFALGLEKRTREWLARRWNDGIYRSGRGGHWKTRSGRAVGHIQFALLFGPMFAWFALFVLLAMGLSAAGVDLR